MISSPFDLRGRVFVAFDFAALRFAFCVDWCCASFFLWVRSAFDSCGIIAVGICGVVSFQYSLFVLDLCCLVVVGAVSDYIAGVCSFPLPYAWL